jgi:nitrous oxide reductase accessory protein NosL
MGHELIPFATEADARTFMKDHRGKQILRFEEVTPQVIEKLD